MCNAFIDVRLKGMGDRFFQSAAATLKKKREH